MKVIFAVSNLDMRNLATENKKIYKTFAKYVCI